MPPNTSTLLEIYDKIMLENCSYCFLCFRTDSERKLKVPQSEIKSTHFLGKAADIHNKPSHICFMCEALALAAAKFRKAAFFATSIDNLFKNMMKSDKYQSGIRRLLNKEEEPTVSRIFKNHKMLFIDEKELTIFRNNMQLQHTEVVVIDSNDVFANDPNTALPTFPNNLDSSAITTEILDDSSSEMDILQTTPDAPSEDIIILDDDPLPPKDKNPIRRSLRTISRTKSNTPPLIKKHIIKKKRIVSVDKLQQLNIQTIPKLEEVNPEPAVVNKTTVGYLYPMYKRPDGTHAVPTLSAQIINGQLQTLPTLEEKVNPDPVVLNKTTVGYLHPIYKRPDGTHAVPTLSAEIVNGQLRIFQGQGNELLPNEANPLAIEGETILSTLTNLDQIGYNNINPKQIKKEIEVEENDDISEVVDKMLVEKLEDMKKSKQFEKVIVDGENKVVKEPLMKSERIDWEDKIPMDVISFMDATDPNPPSYIQPLMSGVICDVRSLQDEDKKQSKEEVIDLC